MAWCRCASAVGGIALCFTPVGWVGLVLGAIGFVISMLKSVFKFFSDSYKMSEQRKATNQVLEKLNDDVKEECSKQIEQYFEQIKERLDVQLEQIHSNIKQYESTSDTLHSLSLKVQNLQKKIKPQI